MLGVRQVRQVRGVRGGAGVPVETIATVAAGAVDRLVRAGLSPAEARIDAAVLIRHVLGWDAGTWLARATEPVPPDLAGPIENAVARRTRREPVSQITGRREFYGRDFIVSVDVLTPRPETEFLIDEALRAIDDAVNTGVEAPRVLDVGTGSGCVAVTLALERPHAIVTATDVSAPALEVARANAVRLGVQDRIRFVRADLVLGGAERFDVIASNPPYVPERDRPDLPPEVRDYEPALALFGGEDGLEVVRRLAPAARVALAAGGMLLIEIGAGQAATVERILETAGFTDIRLVDDLQGIPRIAVGRKVRD